MATTTDLSQRRDFVTGLLDVISEALDQRPDRPTTKKYRNLVKRFAKKCGYPLDEEELNYIVDDGDLPARYKGEN